MHLFWLVFLVPAVILGQWIFPILRQRSIWSVSALVVGTLIVIWLAMGFPTLGNDPLSVQGLLKMFAFRIVAFSDLPLLQLLAACGTGWLIACSLSRFGSREAQSSPQSIETAMDQPVPST